MTDDKREHTRVTEARYAALRVVDGEIVRDDQGFCVVRDLSLGGCQLRGTVDVAVGAGVEVNIGFEEDIRTFPGVVRNTRPGPGRSFDLGIEFEGLSEDAARFIETIVSAHG